MTLRKADTKKSKKKILNLKEKVNELKPKTTTPTGIEDRYRAIIDNIEDGYYEVDLDGNFTFFNDSMTRMAGYSRDELMGMNNREYMDAFNAKKVKRAFKTVYLTGVPTKAFDWEIIRKDGSRCFLEASVSLKRDLTDRPVGFFGIARDITQRRIVERALQESEENYRNIIGNIADGYYEVDLAGNFAFFNDSMVRMVGYSRDELLGMNNRRYMDAFNADKVYKAFNRVYLTGIPTKAFDWELIRKDGSKCYIETSVSLKRDLANRPVGFFGIARDITKRKQIEAVLRAREKELEEKAKRLEELNIALKVLLEKRDEERIRIEEQVVMNVKERILPYVDKAKERADDKQLSGYLDVVDSNIKEIISPFSQKLSAKFYNLSPSEMEVVNLIRQGKSSKEIAEFLNLSTRTIECHRQNVREKMGIKNKNVNLRAYLLSLH